LDEIIFHENADQIGKYQYHPNGLIKRYEFRFEGKLEEYTDYLYSGNKLNSKKTYQITIDGNYQLIRTDTFAYDASGNIEVVYFDKDGSLETIYSFTWEDEKVTRVDYSSAWTGVFHMNFYEIEYDNLGNASKMTYFNNDAEPVLSFIVEYEYDDNVNPLRGMTELKDCMSRNPNNVRKISQRSNQESPPHSVTEIEYTYNEFGLPQKKVEVTDSYGDISSSTVKFLYRRM
jgi:hypothetical protein